MLGGAAAGVDDVLVVIDGDGPRAMSAKRSMRLFDVSSEMASLLFCCLFAARSAAHLSS